MNWNCYIFITLKYDESISFQNKIWHIFGYSTSQKTVLFFEPLAEIDHATIPIRGKKNLRAY